MSVLVFSQYRMLCDTRMAETSADRAL